VEEPDEEQPVQEVSTPSMNNRKKGHGKQSSLQHQANPLHDED
jgi:hypothetical protein